MRLNADPTQGNLPSAPVFPQQAGLCQRAVESAIRYLEVAGQQGEYYRAALDLFDTAEQARKLAEAPEILSRFVSDLEMVAIPSGSFRMGCLTLLCMLFLPESKDNALPAHEVSIQSFACAAAISGINSRYEDIVRGKPDPCRVCNRRVFIVRQPCQRNRGVQDQAAQNRWSSCRRARMSSTLVLAGFQHRRWRS